MVNITQSVRVLVCGSKSHGFKSRYLPYSIGILLKK